MTRLQDLYAIGGQSPWLDNLRRDWLEDGQLAELVSMGVRGITSNPTILAKAIAVYCFYRYPGAHTVYQLTALGEKLYIRVCCFALLCFR